MLISGIELMIFANSKPEEQGAGQSPARGTCKINSSILPK